MNAIVGLCHFCEAHGPRPVFCTFTTDNEAHTTESTTSSVQCQGCTSIGPETVLVSRDDDGTIYCSRETMPNAEITAFLRQAAIRSITCEVSWSKEGGVIYFSDMRGHVLSLMFQLRDTRARGLKRWFSIVVLMKDKMLLLNLTPLLSEHMQKIAKELQDLADVVFDEEQKICSQRSLRLKTGRNDYGQSRSLVQLSGDKDVFKRLHSQFTWMLKAGALTYSETLYTSQDLLKKLHSVNKSSELEVENGCADGMALRDLEALINKTNFRTILYCLLTGINIIIKSKSTDPNIVIESLSRLLPITETNRNISFIKPSFDSDQVIPSTSLCVLEETENNFNCSWPGVIPSKCPTIMNRIESGMNNEKFNNDVLHEHIKYLQLEWIGKVKAVKFAMKSSGLKSDAVMKLKQVFEITPQDDLLINYWINAFC